MSNESVKVESSKVAIKVTFTIPPLDPITEMYDSKNCKPFLVAEGAKFVKPEPGDYSYSGMHDNGPLPTLKEGGSYSELIGCVNEASKNSDTLLTKLIKEQKKV